MDSKREVVIDCDPGIDDALALMLALGSKDIRVVGITVVCGNVGAALGTVNVCRILELMEFSHLLIWPWRITRGYLFLLRHQISLLKKFRTRQLS